MNQSKQGVFMLIRSVAVLFFSSFFMLACQQGSSAPQASSPADIKFSTNAAFAITGPIVTDCTFNNTSVIDGNSITAYQNSSVQFGISCVSELRTCNSGVLVDLIITLLAVLTVRLVVFLTDKQQLMEVLSRPILAPRLIQDQNAFSK